MPIDNIKTPEDLATEASSKAIAGFTATTSAYIQNEVNIYNTANGTAFENVHNCESYSRDNNYNHQQFCLNVWNWNVTVWETVRAYQAGLTEIPTEEEFQAVLDSVPFV